MCEKPSKSTPLKPTRGNHAALTAQAQGRFSMSNLAGYQDRFGSSPLETWALDRFLSDRDDPFTGLTGSVLLRQTGETRCEVKTMTTEAAHGSAAEGNEEPMQAKEVKNKRQKREGEAVKAQPKKKGQKKA